MSITRRNQEEVEVLIHSQYRNNPSATNHTNFTYTLDREISRVSEIKISSIHIPFSFYAINENNNVLHLGAGSSTVPVGNYTVSTLTAALITAMDDILAGTTSTVTYNSTKNKFTLTNDIAFTVDVVSANNIAYVIGFEEPGLSSTSHESDSVVDISGPKHIVLKSSILTQFTAEKNVTANSLSEIYVVNTGVSDNILHTIPINSMPSGVNLDVSTRSNFIRMNTLMKFQDNIDFRLEDDEGNLLNLNGKEWSIKLFFKVR